MSRRHRFHLDHAGHSVTVTVRSGLTSEVELLVDGEEVFHHHLHGSGTSLLTGELPGDPPRPFRVQLHQSRLGTGAPRCVLEIDGVEHPMPESAIV